MGKEWTLIFLSAIPFRKLYPPYNDTDDESNHIRKEDEVFPRVINNLEGMLGDMWTSN
jgi:hypothetical protein